MASPEAVGSSTMHSVCVSAPGKLILHGEHSVVYGKAAIAAALNLRCHASVKVLEEGEDVELCLPDIDVDESWSVTQLENIPCCADESNSPVRPTPEQMEAISILLSTKDKTSASGTALATFLYLYTAICRRRV